MAEITVIYHGNCFDGTAAAWVASKFLVGKINYVPCAYGDPVPAKPLYENKHVYVIDFSFPRNVMEEMAKLANSLTVIDHHKTAQAACEGLPYCTFDMNRSGAGLTWDILSEGKPRPVLIDYIEDRDLWKFALPESAAVHVWIASYSKDISIYDWLSSMLTDYFEQCVSEGKAILRFKDQKVEELAADATLGFINGYEVPIVNCPYQFGSDVAHRLTELYPDKPFAAYFLYDKNGNLRFGLRGKDTDDFDVSEVAKKMGGGGHKKAAGYEIKLK